MTDPAPVSCAAVTRTFALPGAEPVVAVDDVTFTAAAGALTAIVGPSGSGKSTLMQILAGLDRPDSGTVQVAGVDLTRLRDGALSRLRRREIGFVFQSFNLVPSLTARANITLPVELDGGKVDQLRLAALAERLGIADRLNHLPAQLSVGQQQRVAVARALLGEPAVIFADEPTAALDAAAAEELFALLAALAHEQGTTVVLVTHDLRVHGWADHVWTMKAGALLEGTG